MPRQATKGRRCARGDPRIDRRSPLSPAPAQGGMRARLPLGIGANNVFFGELLRDGVKVGWAKDTTVMPRPKDGR